MADVYNAVVTSPQWNETLLIITYDEHGGCYDHYAPPHATPPDAATYNTPGTPGQDGFTFNRYEVRIPTVLISPYIEAGTIARPSGYTPFDHTSVIATVRNCLGLNGYLTSRDRSAPDLSCVLTLSVARSDKPTITPLEQDSESNIDHINNLHRIFEQALIELTGQSRPAEEDLLTFVENIYEKSFSNRETTKPKTKGKKASKARK